MCSILCLLFDNGNTNYSELQYKCENTPANWYSEYTYVKEKDIFAEQLSGNILRKCVKIEETEMKIIDEYFENELKDALDSVVNDVDENLQDFVDSRARAEISKKRK